MTAPAGFSATPTPQQAGADGYPSIRVIAPDGDDATMGSVASQPIATPTTSGTIASVLRSIWAWLLYGPVYEDNVAGKAVVEHRYSYLQLQAEGQVKAGAGFLHTLTIAPLTATPTAGLLTVYDNPAETGTVIYKEWIFATTPGHTVTINAPFTTGCYVGFDGALANVSVTASYR